MSTRPRFVPGRNIAIKVPPDQFNATVRFYTEILGLARLPESDGNSVVIDFGGKRLWLDCVPAMSQAEVWLEVSVAEKEEGEEHLASCGVVRCDEIEPLPPDTRCFWIKSPSGIVHLVSPIDPGDRERPADGVVSP